MASRMNSRSPPPQKMRSFVTPMNAGIRQDSCGRSVGGAQQQCVGSQSFPGPALHCGGGHQLLAPPVSSVAVATSTAASRLPVAVIVAPHCDSPREGVADGMGSSEQLKAAVAGTAPPPVLHHSSSSASMGPLGSSCFQKTSPVNTSRSTVSPWRLSLGATRQPTQAAAMRSEALAGTSSWTSPQLTSEAAISGRMPPPPQLQVPVAFHGRHGSPRGSPRMGSFNSHSYMPRLSARPEHQPRISIPLPLSMRYTSPALNHPMGASVA